ncbi:MAG: hypothetical protein LBN21_09455 [Treponema sp.]|jgi:hypothetical protein|nr:hypothetical protein [Treponema sp.]
MNITINGKAADITLESEKTIGDILAALGDWLENSGFRLSGIDVDGQTIFSDVLEDAFDTDVSGVDNLDIRTSSLAELTAEALLKTRGDLAAYEDAPFGEKRDFAESWGNSPQAGFLAARIPELKDWADRTFSGVGMGAAELRGIIDERLRELTDPIGELNRAGPLIEELVVRLTDLPLDIQTGKDGRAAETIGIFSGAAEKVFRIFNLLKTQGFAVEELKAEGIPVADYVGEFGTALKELLAAYESKDSVLVGDLAEYELAPRLRSLYDAIRAPCPGV